MSATPSLSAMPMFSSLACADLEALAAIAVSKRYPRGATVFSEGHPPEGFHVILSGRVRIFKISIEGKEQTLHVFGPKQPVGEAAVFAGAPYPAHAEALDDCTALFFPRDAFIALLESRPTIALGLLATLAKRLMQFAALVEQLSLKEIPNRLAAYLLHLHRHAPPGAAIDLGMSKKQLATLTGATPETLSRTFTRFEQDGAIQPSGRRHLIILDPEYLARLI
ncbi:MAG TPA: Crp/Fnr family transcriptional regulator [Candidatus Hydrogenedentes bacterium]|nr:Crp/Fnr family transcriptional regulator [Candidatus Hydrogenedentota bacterium]